MTNKEEITIKFQKFMLDLFYEWGMKNRIHNPTDSTFAKEVLGVPGSSYNQWIRGIRLPNVENAYNLYDKLEKEFGIGRGLKLLEILGIKLRVPITDPDLRTLYLQWGKLPNTLKREILRILDQNDK